jgi:hypothetical protein
VKKLAIGCLVILLIGMAAGAVGLYWVYRAARPMIESAGQYMTRAKELASLGDRIADKSSFRAPDDGALNPSQVTRFLAVQRSVQKTLGNRWTELQKTADDLQKRLERDSANVSLADISSFLSNAADVSLEARRAQVDALNAQKFSAAEYRWVRVRVYEAAGVHLADSVDLAALERAVREGSGARDVRMPEIKLPEVPAKNLALVKPHAGELKELLALAVLGL